MKIDKGIRQRGNSLQVQSNKTTWVDGKKKVIREFNTIAIKTTNGKYTEEQFNEALREAQKIKARADVAVSSTGYGKNFKPKAYGVGKLKEVYDSMFVKRWVGTSQEKNIKIYAKDIFNFFPNDVRLDEIQTEEIRHDFIEFVRSEIEKRPMNNMNSVSNKSVNDRLMVMRAIVAYGIKEKLLDKTKVIDETRNDFGWTNLPKGVHKRKRPLSYAEEQMIYQEAINDGELEFADAFHFLIDTGMRHKGEFHNLESKNIDYKNKVLQFFRPKTNVWSVRIPLTDRAFDIAKRKRNLTKLFTITESKIRTLFKRYRDRLKLDEDFTPYCTRHTFITRLVEAGHPPNVVKDLAGHTRVETTLSFYSHSTDTSLHNAINSLNQRPTDVKVLKVVQ